MSIRERETDGDTAPLSARGRELTTAKADYSLSPCDPISVSPLEGFPSWFSSPHRGEKRFFTDWCLLDRRISKMSSSSAALSSPWQLFRTPSRHWRASWWGKFSMNPAGIMGIQWKLPSSSLCLPSREAKMQKSVRYNEGHALFLSAVARKEGTKRGYLSKKTAENSRWSDKFFALYQNVLFYFENEQSARPAGIYLLEGCTCERTPAPKISTTGKEALEKQVRYCCYFYCLKWL